MELSEVQRYHRFSAMFTRGYKRTTICLDRKHVRKPSCCKVELPPLDLAKKQIRTSPDLQSGGFAGEARFENGGSFTILMRMCAH